VSMVPPGGGSAGPVPSYTQIGRQRLEPVTQFAYGTVSGVGGGGFTGYARQILAPVTQIAYGTAEVTDPDFASVVLLVRGTTGFADLSSNAISPTEIGTPTSSAQSGWANSEVLRFVNTATSAVEYDLGSDFLGSDTDDITIEMWVSIDSGVTYDFGDADNRKSFLRLTNGGTLSFRFFVGATGYFALGTPGQSTTATTINNDTRVHIAFCRNASVGNKLQAWVNGTRVFSSAFTSAFNFDKVVWGVSVINGSNRDAKGYAEELRITAGVARYDGATITVPDAPFPEA